jgi:hypothetical protein
LQPKSPATPKERLTASRPVITNSVDPHAQGGGLQPTIQQPEAELTHEHARRTPLCRGAGRAFRRAARRAQLRVNGQWITSRPKKKKKRRFVGSVRVRATYNPARYASSGCHCHTPHCHSELRAGSPGRYEIKGSQSQYSIPPRTSPVSLDSDPGSCGVHSVFGFDHL